MSDERLRALERRWKESGSVEDEARYLLERVRVGEIDRLRLELLAELGCGGAQFAIYNRLLTSPPTFCNRANKEGGSGFLNPYHPLHRWGQVVCVRAALIAARIALDISHSQLDAEYCQICERAFKGVERWIEQPCDDHARQVHIVGSSIHGLMNGWIDHNPGHASLRLHVLSAAWQCASAAATSVYHGPAGQRPIVLVASDDMKHVARNTTLAWWHLNSSLTEEEATRQIDQRICQALIPMLWDTSIPLIDDYQEDPRSQAPKQREMPEAQRILKEGTD